MKYHPAVKKVTEISHEKLLPMPEKLAIMFHHKFYPKQKMTEKMLRYLKRLVKLQILQ